MRFSGLSFHSLFVHFPVALLPVSLLWDLVGIWTGGSLWWALSFWTLVAGLVAVLPAVVTGFIEYAQLSPGTPADKTATRHLLLMGVAVTVFLVSLLVRRGPEELQGARLLGAMACSGVGVVLLTVGGHLGAVLVYRYGVGVSGSEKGFDEPSQVPKAGA